MQILSKTLFPKENIYYANTLDLFIEEPRLGYSKFIFDDEFIHLTRYAISTECITEFTEAQLEFFLDWIEYNNALMRSEMPYPENDPLFSFDREIIKIAECIPDPGEIICGNSDLHTYNTCPG
jgi:hypothetical protein